MHQIYMLCFVWKLGHCTIFFLPYLKKQYATLKLKMTILLCKAGRSLWQQTACNANIYMNPSAIYGHNIINYATSLRWPWSSGLKALKVIYTWISNSGNNLLNKFPCTSFWFFFCWQLGHIKWLHAWHTFI